MERVLDQLRQAGAVGLGTGRELRDQPAPLFLGDGRDKGKGRFQIAELAGRKGLVFTHGGNHHADPVADLDDKAYFFGKSGLDVIIAKIFRLIETIGSQIAQPCQARCRGGGRIKIEGIKKIGPFLIVIDHHLALGSGKIIIQIKRFVVAVIGKDHGEFIGHDAAQRRGEGRGKIGCAKRRDRARTGFEPICHLRFCRHLCSL